MLYKQFSFVFKSYKKIPMQTLMDPSRHNQCQFFFVSETTSSIRVNWCTIFTGYTVVGLNNSSFTVNFTEVYKWYTDSLIK